MRLSRRKKIGIGLLVVFTIWFAQCLPDPLFESPTSTVVEDRTGQLMGARIAGDGQWRFPICDSVPWKFEVAITHFEDEHFRIHPGVNPFSMIRAIKQNIEQGKVVSGGSTLTMQTIRLSKKNPKRTVPEKIVELFQAMRLELAYSKIDILRMYTSNAPFGGNVVGLDAASWRYFGRAPHQLSWSEMCTMAVLPNAPGLIYPGRNQDELLRKRNRLLNKLHAKGFLDDFTLALSKEEALPAKPSPLPDLCKHTLLELTQTRGTGKRFKSTLDPVLQHELSELLHRQHLSLQENGISNGAILVLDNRSNEVLAYIGNTNCPSQDCGKDVDVIQAGRSTGSVLKPLLYASALDDGSILPSSLIADIPTDIGSFSPKNFDRSYDGVVQADNALIRSLNVPFVRLLRSYGLDKFHGRLASLEMEHLNKSASHYGLSLILGGAEISLWDLCRTYKGMAQSLNEIEERAWKYSDQAYDAPQMLMGETSPGKDLDEGLFPAGAIWRTFEVMGALNRPHQEWGWQHFSTSRKVAWKTGTSFGHRDAWAVGVTPEYTIGVWVGNADGEGRAGLTGLNTAAPVLFASFDKLPRTTWFRTPFEELAEISVCKHSGNRLGPHCESAVAVLSPSKGLKASSCRYHQKIHLHPKLEKRVNSDCFDVNQVRAQNRFVLPPQMELYYRRKDPSYRGLPPFDQNCVPNGAAIALIYPSKSNKLFVPRNIGGELSRVVFEFAHQRTNARMHWHLDNDYLGATDLKHKKGVLASTGSHTLTVVDELGNSLSRSFEIIERN